MAKTHIQKCLIEFADGSRATFVGSPQVDTTKPIRIKKFSFTVPREVDEAKEKSIERMMDQLFGGITGARK